MAQQIRTVLADDNPDFLEAAYLFLRTHARRIHIVGEARTGTETLRLIEVLEPDLLLLDLEMPDVDGLEILRRLKAQPRSPRVIIMTLHEQEAYRASATDLGADGFITKRDFVTALMPLIQHLFGDV